MSEFISETVEIKSFDKSLNQTQSPLNEEDVSE